MSLFEVEVIPELNPPVEKILMECLRKEVVAYTRRVQSKKWFLCPFRSLSRGHYMAAHLEHHNEKNIYMANGRTQGVVIRAYFDYCQATRPAAVVCRGNCSCCCIRHHWWRPGIVGVLSSPWRCFSGKIALLLSGYLRTQALSTGLSRWREAASLILRISTAHPALQIFFIHDFDKWSKGGNFSGRAVPSFCYYKWDARFTSQKPRILEWHCTGHYSA